MTQQFIERQFVETTIHRTDNLSKRQFIERQFIERQFTEPKVYRTKADPGGRSPLLKPKKVALFTTIFYNSENSIRDTRPFCRPDY